MRRRVVVPHRIRELLNNLRGGCIYRESSIVDEVRTDMVMVQAANEIERLLDEWQSESEWACKYHEKLQEAEKQIAEMVRGIPDINA